MRGGTGKGWDGFFMSKENYFNRKLMHYLAKYKAGKISLGRLAESLKVSSSEALDYVVTHRAHPHIPKNYLKDATKTAKKLYS